MSKLSVSLTLSLLVTLVSPVARAHHDLLDEIDLNAPVEIIGQVQSLQMTSPHAVLRLAGKDTSGADQIWVIQLADPEQLKALGFSALSVKRGEWVAVIAFPVKGAGCSNECNAYGLTLSDSDNNDFSLNAQINAGLIEWRQSRSNK